MMKMSRVQSQIGKIRGYFSFFPDQLEDNVLPCKGRWAQAGRVRETDSVFRTARV